MTSWHISIGHIGAVIEILTQTSVGKELWEQFLYSSTTRQIDFLAFPEDLKAKLKQSSDSDTPMGAAFVTDGAVGTILYDGEACIGVLLPLVFHELIHSLDESLWKAARNGFSSDHDRREILFAAECRAYLAQFQFLEEMKRSFPEYAQFLKDSYPNVAYFHRAILPNEIAELYKISA